MRYNSKAKQQQAFALPTVIFLMVIVTLLLGMMVNLSSQQSASVDLTLLSARADMAARSALEWATYSVKSADACPGAAPTINGFTVSVTCTSTAFEEGSTSGANIFRYDLEIRAESAGGDRTSPDYAFRKLNATLMVEN